MNFNSIQDIGHDQNINGTNSMHIIEAGDNSLEDDQSSSMVDDDTTNVATGGNEPEGKKIIKGKKRVSAGMDASNIIENGTTRGKTMKQLSWVLEQDASRVARAKVYSAGDISREASHSPLAPLDSTPNSGSLYVEVPWMDVEGMFSYWTMGDQQTYENLLANRNNPTVCWPKKPNFGEHKRVWVSVAFLYLLAQNKNPWTDLDKMRDAALPNVYNEIFKIKTEHKLFSLKTANGFEKASPARDEDGKIKEKQKKKKQIQGDHQEENEDGLIKTKQKKKKKQIQDDHQEEENEDDLWVPLRDDLGQLILCKHIGSWQTPRQANFIKMKWKRALETLNAPSGSTGSNSARYQTVKVGELMITLTPLGAQRFRKRECKPKGVFNHFINKINKNKDFNGGTAKFLEDEKELPGDYQFLSEHPFGLYRTYIKSSSYDAYMKQLLAGCFETEQEERAIYDPVPHPVTGRTPDVIDPRGLPKDIKKLIKDLKPIDEKTQKRSKKQTDARADGLKAIELGDRRAAIKEPSTGDIQTKTFVTITAEKAQLARGARKREKASQGVVMGESASKRCVNFFGWKWTSPDHRSKNWPTNPLRDPALPSRVTPFRENEMYNGLFIAEWLHLSAYSWGGLADPKYDGVKKESLASSSQVPENLVIGTSETNSAMTRWEKAWQKLVQVEGEILASEGEDGSQYGGLLTITRHPFEFRTPNPAAREQRRPYLHKETYASYLHDVAVPTPQDKKIPEDEEMPEEKQIREEKEISENKEIPEEKEISENKEIPEDKKRPFRYVVRRKQWTPELVALAKEFRWICFQFDYDIKLKGASRLLDLPAGCVKGQNRFYPFRRMLFHKIEHDLDSELWKDLKREAVEGLWSEYNDGIVTYRKVPGHYVHKKTRYPWVE